jgi:group I intron endonuclease
MSEDTYGCIYRISCNNKSYIGQHSKINPKERFKKHICLAYSESKKKYNLHHAIKKHGVDAFIFERLCVCKHSELGNMEAYYAEQFESYIWDTPGGYNMVWCGEKSRLGITHAEEVREKLRQINTGRKVSEETKIKMSESQTGKKRSQESCENIKQGKRSNPISKEGLESIIKHNTGRKMSEQARENMKISRAYNKLIKQEEDIPNTLVKKLFECTHEGCDKKLSSKGSLKLHERIHTGEKPFKCINEGCEKAFACGSNLDQHMKTHLRKRT